MNRRRGGLYIPEFQVFKELGFFNGAAGEATIASKATATKIGQKAESIESSND